MPIDRKLAVRLAKACLWVYDFAPSKKAELLKVRGKLPRRTVKIADDHDRTSFAGVMEYPDIVVVAFQGTITEFGLNGKFRLDSLIDWIQNFRVQQLETAETKLPGLVHEGFFRQLELIAEKVADALPKQGDKPIVLTGHSQGGAVATLATKLLKDRGLPRKSVAFAAHFLGRLASFLRARYHLGQSRKEPVPRDHHGRRDPHSVRHRARRP